MTISLPLTRTRKNRAWLSCSPRQKLWKLLIWHFRHCLTICNTQKKEQAQCGESLVVVVEAGWMVRKSNFHDAQGHRAEKIAKDVGANHETGRKIIEMCKHYGIEVVQHAPLVKCWKGKDRKITHEELASITGLIGRTNQDARDAALLAWVFAGLPIRLKC